MKIGFFHSDKPRERDLSKAFLTGLAINGAKVEAHSNSDLAALAGLDAAAMVGVKSRKLWKAAIKAGVIPIMLDKGYIRTRAAGSRVWEYWRVSVGGHHPIATIDRPRQKDDRWKALGIEIKPWRSRGFSIVIAGSSAKYHEFHGLPEPTIWAADIAMQIRKYSDAPIIYRPKPSWDGAVPIDGTEYSGGDESITSVLEGAACLITHGSNACFEAALLGVPSIVIGEGVLAPISSRSVADIKNPLRQKRDQLFANLAYHQWTEVEMRTGLAAGHIIEMIEKVQNGGAK
jgi:hypothetical protein